jgi:hypothetical protein
MATDYLWILEKPPVMSAREEKAELSEVMLEVGGRLFPRLYKRHGDLRNQGEVRQWAEKLDWRNNPYDRYLLRRELLRHIESYRYDMPGCNVGLFAKRDQILKQIDYLLDNFPEELNRMGIFMYVVVALPFYMQRGRGKDRHVNWKATVMEKLKV